MSLAEIQRAFGAALYEDDPHALAQLTLGPGRVSALGAIEVYQNNTRERLRSVLTQAYPVCRELIGARCFNQLTLAHVQEHPCRTHDLDNYGAEFPETVRNVLQEQALLRDSVPYLVDMAKLEWLAHRAYFAPPRSRFDFEAFAPLDEQAYLAVRFELAADLALLELDWPITTVWQMHQPENEVQAVSLAAQQEYVVVERLQYRTQVAAIEQPLFEALSLISRGEPLQALIESLPDVQEALSQALRAGWITGFKTDR
jgi:hypothetical protein